MVYVKCVTPEQQEALEELRNRVKHELTSPALLEDDALFYKFFKARDFNVDKAEKMLKKHLVWRKVYGADNILETFTPKEVFVKYVEPSVVGFDKDGDIVTYVSTINNPELVKCMKINDYIKHWIWFGEKHTALNNRQNKKGGLNATATLIMDLETLDFANTTSKVTVDILLRLTRLIRENYAQRLKAAYVINAPSYYVFVFKIIKVFMTRTMLERIHVYSCSGWKEKLLEAIDEDVLPVFLGGKKTDSDGDPYCKSFITSSREIPQKYYLSDEERYFKHQDDIIRITIPPSEKKEIQVFIKEPESLIRWKFVVANKTIAFGLFFKDSNEELKELIPLYEYDTSDGTEEGSFECIFEGIYVIVFDNSYSRFSSKEVQYVIQVVKPEI